MSLPFPPSQVWSRFDPVTGTLDLSDQGMVSLSVEHRVNDAITANNLVDVLECVGLDTMRIKRLDVSRCCLTDNDLIELGKNVLRYFSAIDRLILNENWFLYVYGPPYTVDNPVCRSLKRLLRWNVMVDIAGTNLASSDFLAMFVPEEQVWLRNYVPRSSSEEGERLVSWSA